MFDGLEASQGAAAVLGVATFLDRVDALEKWSETTPAVVQRRGYPIRVGLAKRKFKKDAAEPTPPV